MLNASPPFPPPPPPLPEGLFELSGSCLLRCPENFFSDEGRCIPCDGPCPRGKRDLLVTMATRIFVELHPSYSWRHFSSFFSACGHELPVGFKLLLWMDSLSTFKLPYLELSYYWVVTSATLHLMKSCGYCVTLSFLCRVWGAWSWNTDCGWHYYWPVPGVQHRHHWGRVYRWYSWPKL